MPRPALDLRQRTFGRLRPLEPAGQRQWSCGKKKMWLCLCDPALGGCGRYKTTTYHALRGGSCRSCGCLLYERPGRHEVVGPDGAHHRSLAAAAATTGLWRSRLSRMLADPASGWRRA